MSRRWLVLILAGACGGSQQSAASGSDNRKISALEDQLEDTRNDLKKERESRAQAEQALAAANAKCAAEVAAATKAATPPPTPAMPPPALAPATQPAPAPSPLPAAPKPVAARVTEKSAAGPNVRLIIGVGRNRGVAPGWSGQLFSGKTDKVVARFKVTSVRENECEAIVTGTTIQAIGANDRVELLAPAPPGAPQ